MKVDVLASTTLDPCLMSDAYSYDVYPVGHKMASDADALAEAAGRICFKSFNRPNPATAANADYLANILYQGHYSVLEHASVTFLVRDVSRALLTELTRHRHLSFSVVSQRYVDYSDTEPVIPPAVDPTSLAASGIEEAYEHAIDVYQDLVHELMQHLPRKQAREAARAVLPNAAPVDMVVTANLRGYRDMISKRWHVAADAEIRELAGLILGHLRELAPNSVQDLPEEPFN